MEELGKRCKIVVPYLLGIDPYADASWYVSLFAELFLKPILGYQYRDTEKMKEILSHFESLDWTLDGSALAPATENYVFERKTVKRYRSPIPNLEFLRP